MDMTGSNIIIIVSIELRQEGKTDLNKLFCDTPDEEQTTSDLGGSCWKRTSNPTKGDMKDFKNGKALDKSSLGPDTKVGSLCTLAKGAEEGRDLGFQWLGRREIQEGQMREPTCKGVGGRVRGKMIEVGFSIQVKEVDKQGGKDIAPA
jgi:hypothetical protein